MSGWIDRLNGDPLPWLLEDSSPAVRHLALRQLLALPEDEPSVAAARLAALRGHPIADILAAQDQSGTALACDRWPLAGDAGRGQDRGARLVR